MFRYSVLQYQWLILAMCSGLALVLSTVLTYMMIWRPRKSNEEAMAESEYRGYSTLQWYVSFMPWVLTLTFVSVIVFAIVYALIMIWNPPNW